MSGAAGESWRQTGTLLLVSMECMQSSFPADMFMSKFTLGSAPGMTLQAPGHEGDYIAWLTTGVVAPVKRARQAKGVSDAYKQEWLLTGELSSSSCKHFSTLCSM